MDCEFSSKTIWFMLMAFYVVASQIAKLLKKANQEKQKGQESDVVAQPEDEWAGEEGSDEATQVEAVLEELSSPVDPWVAVRNDYEQRRTRAFEHSKEMMRSVVHERYNQLFVDAIQVYVPRQLEEARTEIQSSDANLIKHGGARIDHVEMVLTLIEYMIEQRRDPELRPLLGDADRLADDCYRPVLVWARSAGVSTTSNHPAVILGDFELSIATGLIPTSVAPILLPEDFFERAVWWPGLAHEIGHDFFVSVVGLSDSLRQDLDLPTAESGARLVPISQGGIALSDIRRAFGAWLEEIFCDVFGVMMSGPAYLATMVEVFADPDNPESVTTTALDDGETGLSAHPPGHLRFLLASRILSEAGFKKDADALQPRWLAANGLEAMPEHIYLATTAGFVRVPVEPLLKISEEIGVRIYRGPLSGLNGRGLSGISGLDYGPHRHNETGRARDALLAGFVPDVRDSRAVMSGAVLAAMDSPQGEQDILRLARQAITALGASKKRSVAYDLDTSLAGRASDVFEGDAAVADVVGGIIFAEVIRRPGNRRSVLHR